ncbi:T9SS sorting signal type C domain-containing protein [Flavobacterium zepuense]|uniref:T9SS sorting signal type C domain-containing protein n=1 Tax=Flavobacterium zepuense TaxID=2593302 RepID=A0A552UXD4_9FLAO|nr:Ig-like domain-containing protein [Flavobacterium zepuense]TRW22867.1 T9SS sorting signal type C domain-containing protein [Flavobacterium zepuense]
MKKLFTLLFLVSFVGFAQNLATWNTTTPTVYGSNITVGTMTPVGGVSIENNNYGQTNSGSGYRVNGFQTGTANNPISYAKYIEFTISPASGYNATLSQFNFTYLSPTGNNGAQKLQVRYSTSSAFTGNGTLLGTEQTLTQGANTALSLNFGNMLVMQNTTLYIRLYIYGQGNTGYGDFYIRNTNYQNTAGPSLTGTVASSTGLIATADAISTTETVAVSNFNILSNDVATGTTINTVTVTQPATGQGTVTLNANNTVNYNPGTFSGTTSFTYTIKSPGNTYTSTATVSVTVTPFASPTANADTATTGKNIATTIDVLANDTAGSGTLNGVTIVSVTNGTATVDSYNRIIFTPTNNSTATGVITYKATNTNGKSSANTTATITVVNPTAPTVANDPATTPKNTAITLNVLANDTSGNSALAYLIVSVVPQHGTAVINEDNTITYTPTNGYLGTDSFNYRLYNAYGLYATGVVNMTVINQTTTGALCGTYTVGTGGNFTTITQAINYLNNNGVQCPVTFLLSNALYNEASGESFPLTINQFTGTSSVNTVTFKPATGKNVTIKANDITINNNNYQAAAIFKLNGADNIIFDGSNTTGGTSLNLTVFNNNSLNYLNRTVFWVASNSTNGSTNVTIKYTKIRQGVKNQGGKFCIGIYSGNNTESIANNNVGNHDITMGNALANNSGLTVLANDFTNVKQGIYILGGASTGLFATNQVIQKNDLGSETNAETIILPAYLSNVNGFEYSENQIYNLLRDTSDGGLASTGIYVANNSQNGSIVKNNIKELTKTASENGVFAGIAMASTNAASNIVIANNFIYNVSGNASGSLVQNGFGIYLASGGGYKIYHNTVVLNKNQNGNGYSAALLINDGITATDVRNNIFVNTQTAGTRRCAIILLKATNVATSSVVTNLDYNDYYSSDRIGFFGTGQNDANSANYITTLSAWKTATGLDTNTTDINPVFADASDLHIDTANTQNTGINNTGTPITVVTKDIDGQKRSAATPDMGADEWGPLVIPAPGSNAGIYCDSSTTYSTTLWPNGTNWSNGLPSSVKDVIFNSDFTQTGGTFNACSIYVLAGADVIFTGNSNAIVQHSVNVATGATLTFNSGSNLQQVENDKNAGTVTIKRKGGFLKRLDYTMWSSPVVDSRTSGFQTIGTFSPFTAVNRFYEFMTELNQYASIATPATTKFALGKGYLIRMPNAINGTTNNGYYQGTARYTFEGSFEGTPNNGVIKLPLKYFAGTDKSFNAIGNPYPSPISIRDFISQNIDVIDGTLYFWRKTNDHTQTTYSACNLEAYTANAAPGGTSADGNTAITDPYTIDADKGVLNTGQGFIVKALTTGKEVVFRNNMRVKNNSTFFFKMGQDTQEDETTSTEAPGRMWINITNTSGDFTQAVVAYNPATSLDYDNGYDGKVLTAGNISLYSLLQSESEPLQLIIQSRGNFVATDKVALGFKADLAGNFEIALDHVDGVFAAGQEVYVVDRLTGTTNNITNSSYAFTTEIGTFDNRFELVYAPQAQLGTDTPVLNAKELVVYRNGKQINIQAPANMKAVTVYDILGKTLFTKGNVDATDFATTDINVAQQVLIVQITMESGQVISKKIMVN